MIFASIYKGEYLIIENDIVIGRILRFKKQLRQGREWTRDLYLLEWNDKSKKVEKYSTLPEIQSVHMFENFPAYGRVLHKPGKVKYASEAEYNVLTKYDRRVRSRYIRA